MKASNMTGRGSRAGLFIILMTAALFVVCVSVAVAQPGPVLQITKSVDEDTIWHDDCDLIPTESRVTIRLYGAGACTTVGMPVDVMLVLDRSGSMMGAPIDSAKAGARHFVDLLRNGDRDRGGLVSFGESVTLNMMLSHMTASGKGLLKGAINYLSAYGYTPIGDAIFTANNQFEHGRAGVDWVEILLSDGDPKTFTGRSPISAANEAAAMGVQIFVIGLSVNNAANKATLQQIASITGGAYYDAPTPAHLHDIFEAIAYEVICTAGRDIVVTERVQNYFAVKNGCSGFTKTPAYCYLNPDNSLTAMWNIPQIDVGEEWTVSFVVTSDVIGDTLGVDVLANSKVTLTNYLGPITRQIPQAYITVRDCTPDIGATKRDVLAGEKYPDGKFSPGDTIRYEVEIVNTGYDATLVEYCDTLDTYTTLLPDSITTSDGTVTVAGGNGSFCVDIGTIAEGASVDIAFLAVIDDPIPESLTQVVNQGFVASKELDDVPTDDPDTGIEDDPTVTPIVSKAIVEATKADVVLGGGNLVPGGTIIYTVTLQNVGNKVVSGLTYYDAVPAHTSYVSASLQNNCGGTISGTNPIQITNLTLAPNGGCTIIYRVLVDDPVPAGVNQIVNQGFVQNIPGESNEPTDDPDTVPDDDPTITPLVADPVIEVEKVDAIVGGAAAVVPGGFIDYTVTVCNTGDEGAEGLAFTDTIPEYTSYVQASFHSTCVDGQQNIGNQVLRVNDFDLPGGDACCNITFRVKVNDTVPEGVDSVANQAFVDLPWDGIVLSDDPDTGTPDDSTKTPLEAGPFIVVEKTDAVAGGGNCAVPGDIIHYTVSICNTGNRNATGMSFADGIPENTSYVSASASSDCDGIYLDGDTLRIDSFDLDGLGDCCQVTFSVIVDLGVSNTVEWISNQAFVRDIGNSQGTVPSDDPGTPAEQRDPTDTCLETGVNIEVNKVDFDVNGSPLYPGETIRYTVTITNNGPEDATGLTYTDPTPTYTTFLSLTSQTCGSVSGTNPLSVTGINLDAGQSCTIVYRVRLDSTIPEGVTKITNQGEVCNIPDDGGTICEPSNDPGTPPDDDPTDTPIERPQPPFGWDPVLVKVAANLSDPGQSLEPGDVIRYMIDIENPMEIDLLDHVFEDELPDWTGDLVVTGIPSGATNASTADAVIITGIFLPAGGSRQVSFLVTLDPEVPGTVNQICNEAVVHDLPDENEAWSNRACLPIDHGQLVWDPEIEAFLTATNGDGGTLRAGDVIEYTLNMTNLGPHEAHTMAFYCPLPEYTRNLQVSDVPAGAVNLSLPDLIIVSGIAIDVTESAEITFSVQVDPVVPAGATQVSCQGWIANIPFMPDEWTDDPGTQVLHDATVLALEAGSMKCDINDDGLVTLADLFLQLRQVVRDVELTDDQYWAADFNGNATVDILDLMGCVNISLGALPKSQPGSISLSVPAEVRQNDGRVSVPLLLDSPVPVGGAWISVTYDPEVLTPEGIVTTASSSDMSLAREVNETSIRILLHSESGRTISAGSAPVAMLQFSVNPASDGVTPITIDQGIAFLPPSEAVMLEPSEQMVSFKISVPERFVLEQNVPNPFNPDTRITYHLPQDEHVRLDVFNLLGQRIVTLVDEHRAAGSWTVTWSGCDQQGVQVPSGIYFYTIRSGRYIDTKRMVLTK